MLSVGILQFYGYVGIGCQVFAGDTLRSGEKCVVELQLTWLVSAWLKLGFQCGG